MCVRNSHGSENALHLLLELCEADSVLFSSTARATTFIRNLVCLLLVFFQIVSPVSQAGLQLLM